MWAENKQKNKVYSTLTCHFHKILDFFSIQNPWGGQKPWRRIKALFEGPCLVCISKIWYIYVTMCKKLKTNQTFMHTHIHTCIHPPTPSTRTTTHLTLITMTTSSKSSIWSRTGERARERQSLKWHISFTFWHIKRILKKQGHEYCTSFLS